MKHSRLVPGQEVPEGQRETIAQQIDNLLNPNRLAPIDLWDELISIDKADVLDKINNTSSDSFYLLHTIYRNEKKLADRVYVAPREDVLKFVEEQFDEEYDQGIDIIITDTDYQFVIMCNHDCVFMTR